MQVNIFSPNYKKYFLYLGWVLLFIVLWFKGCESSKPQIAQIKIKEVTKTLPADTIIKHQVVKVPNKTNAKLSKDILQMYDRMEAYQEEIDNMQIEYKYSDSVQKAKLYALATELKKFDSEFEDDKIKLLISGYVSGSRVKEITPTYTIKEQKINVPLAKSKISVLTGVFLANDTQLQKPLFGAELGIINKKGNQLKIAFDIEKRIYFGYSVKLF
jgi:hypothetical protein